MGDVYVLGAGFSRAVSERMPLMNELADCIAPELRLPSYAPTYGGDFEAWLTALAADLPWLTEAEQLVLRGTFLEASTLLGSLIDDRESEARSADLPDWFARLICHWHASRATVVTLNYDCLVEAAYTDAVTVSSGGPENYAAWRQLYPLEITPAASRGGAVLGASRAATFVLLKLHGSRSWYSAGRALSHGQLLLSLDDAAGWARVVRDSYRYVGDRVPLVVPPTYAFSPGR